MNDFFDHKGEWAEFSFIYIKKKKKKNLVANPVL